MVSTAPNAIDVVDFQFREHLRLKSFTNAAFADPCSLVTVASRYGLIFIAGNAPELQVVQVKDIEGLSKEVSEFKKRIIPLQSKTLHISVNCDSTKLAVVIVKDNCPHVEFYDVPSFLKQTPKIINHTRLSANAACKILQIDWNPALPDVFTAVKDDGSLLLYEFKGAPIELPPAANATCFCWSPKGKQLAVGGRDGQITQYKIDLKAVKVVEAPPDYGAIVSLCWVSSFQFFGVYKARDAANLVCVDAPKAGAPVYTNYYDVCYSNGNARPEQFYLLHQLNWNVLFVASANSMEIAVLGMDANGKWTQWNLNDNCRAALPLGPKHEDTLPIGCALNVGATQYKLADETKRGPALLVLSDHGTLVMFNAINARPGAADIAVPSEPVADRSGDGLFVARPHLPSSPAAQSTPAPQQVQGQPQVVKPAATVTPLPPATTAAQTPKVASNSVPVTQTTQNPSHAPPPPANSLVVAATSAQNAQLQPDVRTNDKLPVTLETEAMIETLVRDEFANVEGELRGLLQRGAATARAHIGTEDEKKSIASAAAELERFYADAKENTHTHDGEVCDLKQHLLQSWACYEEAHARVAGLKDPVTKVLLQSMPLDPGTQHQLDEIDRYVYYIDSQLAQANRCLDEQWDAFQDSLTKRGKIQLPTMETVYQSMVKQTKTLQKQKYMLKHISARIRASHRSNDASLLNATALSGESVEHLQEQLRKLQVQQNAVPQLYNRLVEHQSKLNAGKVRRVQDVLVHRETSRVCASKTQLHNATLQLSTLFAATLSPIGKKSVDGEPDHLVYSTPKPKMPKVPVQTFTPTAQAFGKSPFMQATDAGPQASAFDDPDVVPVPGPGNTSAGCSETPAKPAQAPAPAASVSTTIAGFSKSGFSFSYTGTKSTFGFGLSTTTTTTTTTAGGLKVDFSRFGTKPPLLATPTTPPVAASSIFGAAAAAGSTAAGSFGGAKASTPGVAASATAAAAVPPQSPKTVAPSAASPASTGGSTTSGTPLFGSDAAVSSGSLFGSNTSIFGKSAGAPSSSTTSVFGGAATFAAPTVSSAQGSLFGAAVVTTAAAATVPTKTFGSAGAIFGMAGDSPPMSAFGAPAATTKTTATFAASPIVTTVTSPAQPPTGMFAATTTATPATTKPSFGGTTSIAGAVPPASGFGAFGTTAATTPVTSAAAATAATLQPGKAFGSFVFGTPASAAKTTTAPLFGGATTATSTPPFGGTASGFGLASSASSPSPVTSATPPAFGVATTIVPAFGAPTTSAPVFGSTATSTSAPAFGATPTTASGFGTATTTAAAAAPAFRSGGMFGSSAFGGTTSVFAGAGTTPTTTSSAPPAFGSSASTTSPFASSPFTPSTTTTPFGGTSGGGFSSSGNLFAQPAKFAAGGSIFGGGTASASPAATTTAAASAFGSSTSVFGSAASTPSPFGGAAFGSSSNSPFAATTQSGGFGSPTTFGSGPAFGASATASAAFASPTSNAFGGFGGLSVGGSFKSPTASSSPAANPFGGGGGKTEQPKSPFGATAANLFASPTSATSFGSASSFGQSGAFGNASFGAAPTGAFSAGSQSVQQAGFGAAAGFQKPAFGSAPVFGAQPAFGAAPTFGGGATFGSPGKVFGGGAGRPEASATPFGGATAQSSTFGSIAQQNAVGFGNLAQQAATPSSALPFSGGSSFTNWRN